MDSDSASARAGKHFESNIATENARQQNGDQIYSRVEHLYQGDVWIPSLPPAFVPRSGYLSPKRWLDEPKTNFAIIEAARYIQIQRLALLLQQPDKDVDFLNYEGMSALHYAVQHGHFAAVKLLLDRGGANPGIQVSDKTSPTPLMVAARQGHLEIAEYLVSIGAPLDSVWYFKPDPSIQASHRLRKPDGQVFDVVTEAIMGGNIDMVGMLLSRQAHVRCETVDHGDAIELDPLPLAMLSGRHDIVKLLLAHIDLPLRMRFYIEDKRIETPEFTPLFATMVDRYLYVTPLVWAVLQQGNTQLLRVIVEHIPFGSRSSLNEAFHLAALIEDTEAMRSLLRSGVNVDCEHQGRTALQLVSFYGKTTSVKSLLEHGANIDKLNAGIDLKEMKSWETDLSSFFQSHSQFDEPSRLELCLSAGYLKHVVNLVVRSPWSSPPPSTSAHVIHYAVPHLEVLDLLLAKGIDVSIASPHTGFTPLHVAAAWLLPDSAKYLIDHGASVHSKCLLPVGCTPFDVANEQLPQENFERARKQEILEFLRVTPLSDFSKVVRMEIPAASKRFFSFSSETPLPSQYDDEQSYDGSWALSENYSANSWAVSERYSIRSQRHSSIRANDIIIERAEAGQDSDRPVIIVRPPRSDNTELVSSDNVHRSHESFSSRDRPEYQEVDITRHGRNQNHAVSSPPFLGADS